MPEARNFRGSFSGYERDHFFWNVNERNDFIDLSYSLGLDFSDDGRSFAPVDIDGDGDLDLPMLSLQSLRLMQNTLTSTTHRFTRIRLKATKTQHHALDAEVLVTHHGVTQRDYVKTNAGFQTQIPLDLHFGLGEMKRTQLIEQLEVRWPSGAIETHKNLPSNQLLLITEGKKPVAQELPRWAPITHLPKRTQDLYAEATTLEGKKSPLAKPGKPTLVNFWAPWCAPCQKELPEIAQLQKEYQSKLNIVGVSAETKDLASVRESIKHFGLTYPQFLGNNELLESFFGGDGEAPLPSSFLFDAAGQLRRVYHRIVGQKEIRAVLEGFEAEAEKSQYLLSNAEAAMGRGALKEAEKLLRTANQNAPANPFIQAQLGTVLTMTDRLEEGMRFLSQAVKLDPDLPHAWYRLAWSHKEKGKYEAALKAYRQAVKLKPTDETYLLGEGAMLSRVGRNEEAVTVFEKVVKRSPKSVEGWLNLGKTRALLERMDCIPAFKRVLELEPNHAEAKRLLVMVQQLR